MNETGSSGLVDHLGRGTGSALWSLDAGWLYLRRYGHRILPLYVAAQAPFTIIVLYLIDAVVVQDRPALRLGCGLLALASLWRWGWLAAAQRRIQEDCRGEPPLPLRRRLAPILLFRLLASLPLTWGSLLVVPFFYAFFAAGFTAPVLLEQEGPAWQLLWQQWHRLHAAAARLGRVLATLAAAGLAALATAVVWHLVLVSVVLNSILGFDTAELALTLTGTAWVLSVAYFLFVLFDVYWTVTSVILFYDLQARRLGSDLRRRLRTLREAA